MQYQEINPNGHEVQLDGVVGIEGDGTVLLGLGALLVSGVSCLLVSRKTLLNNKGKLAKIYFRTLIADSTIVLVHLLDASQLHDELIFSILRMQLSDKSFCR